MASAIWYKALDGVVVFVQGWLNDQNLIQSFWFMLLIGSGFGPKSEVCKKSA